MTDIEDVRVRDAIKELYWEFAIDAPWVHSDSTEYQEISLQAWMRFAQKLKGCGFFKSVDLIRAKQLVQKTSEYNSLVKEFQAGVTTKHAFANYCATTSKLELVDLLCRLQQQQFGLPVIGYRASPRLRKGRELLARYHKRHVEGEHPIEELEKGIINLGFASLAEFLKINTELP